MNYNQKQAQAWADRAAQLGGYAAFYMGFGKGVLAAEFAKQAWRCALASQAELRLASLEAVTVAFEREQDERAAELAGVEVN